MTTSQAGIDLIKQVEGFCGTAYTCPAGVLTIGYGHTGKDVIPGLTITKEQAEKLLKKDVASAEKAVNAQTTVPLTQGQFDALVSFTFNLGCGALESSTLLKKVNTKDMAGASTEFHRWVYGPEKQVLPGLIVRREKEKALFLA